MKKQWLVLVVLSMVCGLAWANIVIDGDLSDWGVATPTMQDGNDWTPNPEIEWWMSEDEVGSGGRVWPGWGGQDFDVEAIYAYLEGNTFYVAVATGTDPAGEPWRN